MVGELLAGGVEHVDVDVRDGAERAALHQDRPLVEDLGGLEDLAGRREHRRVAEPELDELQAHQAVVDRPELGPGEVDHVDLDPLGR